MRIEDINPENVRLLLDVELKNLKEVASQLFRTSDRWSRQLAKRMVGINQPIKRDRLMKAAEALVAEIRRRGLDTKQSELDTKLLRKAMRGVDVAELPVILVKSTVVSLSGGFVTNPKQADAVEVRIDADELDDDFTAELEKRMVEGLMDQTGKSVSVHRDAEGLEAPVIPVYDLALIPRGETIDESSIDELSKRLEFRTCGSTGEEVEQTTTGDGVPVIEYTDISKPYPNEHAARQASPKGFDRIRRKNNEFGPGIHAIYGIKGGKATLQSIRFSASKYTVAQAKVWLKAHKKKTSVEAASGKVKKAEDIKFIRSEAERIVGGVIYRAGPENIDSQGDYATGEDIWKGLKSWMLSGHRLNFMHQGQAIHTPLIECFWAETETTKNGVPVPAEAWYISAYVPEDQEELWASILSGDITGFSMSGTAKAIVEAVGE